MNGNMKYNLKERIGSEILPLWIMWAHMVNYQEGCDTWDIEIIEGEL